MSESTFQPAVGADELRRVSFGAADEPLRDDVRRVGAIVGEMLAEQVGPAFLEQVERVRTTAIRRREDAESFEALAALLQRLPVETAEALTRAFSTYFHAVNIAERVHRIRRRREYERDGSGPQPDGLVDVLTKLKASGVSSREILHWLGRLEVEPVFTAHPTEAVRRALLVKEQEITRCLIDEFDPSRTPHEQAADWARLRMALTAGWQTSETAAERPTVRDEFDHVGFYLSGPIYAIVPSFYELAEEAILKVYGVETELPKLLRFGSWVGGDMDGNPNVNADTIRAALAAQREQILSRYRDDVADLANLLTQTLRRVDISTELALAIERYQRMFPEQFEAIRPRHRDMPYRVFLTLMRARLHATERDQPQAYPDASAFIEDLRRIADSLLANKGLHAGWFAVRRLQWRAHSFGFHLARLDVRQDSRVHATAVAALLADAEWDAHSPELQAEKLRGYAGGQQEFDAGCDDDAATRTREVMVALAESRSRYGSEATGLYIISMARVAADVLAVLALARYGRFTDAEHRVPLDIAPLFETVDDLARGPDSLRALFEDPVYRAHLTARGDQQYVMLGYSDSGKDGGTVASRWGLQRAQVELLEVGIAFGVRIVFFHGRGGSASRGGARIGPALMASPRGSVAGRLRVTEQGEVIHRKFGVRALALRTLEQTVGAVLRASLRPRRPESREEAWKERMAQLAVSSRQTYREFVDHPGFVEYFRSATPIDVIERMSLGSRPSRRGTMKGVESLRAIPWVFAWTQCRAIITAWYGLGSALQQAAADGGEAQLMEMARDWAFFRTMLDDIEMVLAKADLDIAERFSALSGAQHAVFFPLIRDEYARTREWILRLKGQQRLLESDPRLARSIRLRNPYVDPISLIQVDLLSRWRAAGSADGPLLNALVSTVSGVSQGLQNTG